MVVPTKSLGSILILTASLSILLVSCEQQHQQVVLQQAITSVPSSALNAASTVNVAVVPSSLSSTGASNSSSDKVTSNRIGDSPQEQIVSSQGYEQQQQQQQQQLQQRQILSDTQERVIWPTVDVNNQPNRSTVDVHVPIFFDMINHKDQEAGKHKLDLSVLQGLVTVNKDKARDQNGQMAGPIKVTVLGIPVYVSKGVPPTPSQSRIALDNNIGAANSTLNARADDLTDKVQRTSDKMVKSLSDIFDRFTSMVRRTGNSLSNSASNYAQQQQQLNPQPQQNMELTLVEPNRPLYKSAVQVPATAGAATAGSNIVDTSSKVVIKSS